MLGHSPHPPLDLSKETIIPGKTIFKLRDGELAVFINAEGTRYRICQIGTDRGSFKVGTLGKLATDQSTRIEDENDIVAIQRPWSPKQGELVTVVGFGMISGGTRAVDLTDRDCLVTAQGDGGAREVEDNHLVRYIAQGDGGAREVEDNHLVRYIVHVKQLRRYKAPQASEALWQSTDFPF